jgi:hypothetical protein
VPGAAVQYRRPWYARHVLLALYHGCFGSCVPSVCGRMQSCVVCALLWPRVLSESSSRRPGACCLLEAHVTQCLQPMLGGGWGCPKAVCCGWGVSHAWGVVHCLWSYVVMLLVSLVKHGATFCSLSCTFATATFWRAGQGHPGDVMHGAVHSAAVCCVGTPYNC